MWVTNGYIELSGEDTWSEVVPKGALESFLESVGATYSCDWYLDKGNMLKTNVVYGKS